MKKAFWKHYWSDKTNGQHRSQTEEFLVNESKEKLFHLSGGESILDVGCGSADLLVYYATSYEYCIGADWSNSMIEKAYERLKKFNLHDKVHLINADDSQIWLSIKEKFGNEFTFDRITAGQVVQYLSREQIDNFINQAESYLSPNGRICLFDVVDSRTYELWRAGLFNGERINMRVVYNLIIGKIRAIKNKWIGKPTHDLGYIYSPRLFQKLADKYKLRITFAHSIYYEYRYHVILYK